MDLSIESSIGEKQEINTNNLSEFNLTLAVSYQVLLQCHQIERPTCSTLLMTL